jgi:hypothetical protein
MRTQTYYRRLKALEIEVAKRRGTWRGIFQQALPRSAEDQLALLCVYGKERRGIPLSVEDAADKQDYIEAVQRECGLVGLQPPPPAACNIDVVFLIRAVLDYHTEKACHLELCRDAINAIEQGRVLNQKQWEALLLREASLKGLCDAAGFDSVEEFVEFWAVEKLMDDYWIDSIPKSQNLSPKNQSQCDWCYPQA